MKYKYFLLFVVLAFASAQYQTNLQFQNLHVKPDITSSTTDNFSLQDDYSSSIDDAVYLDKTINPERYIVGPGDKFLFNLVSSDGVVSKTLIVSPMGEVLVPVVGTIFVDKLTLENAIERVQTKCLDRYKNASIYLTLKEIRQFKVLVIGTVNNPGFVVVNPLSRVSDVLEFVGGDSLIVSDVDSLKKPISTRNIVLHRGVDKYRIDIDKYNMFGSEELNPNLLEGDIIKISLLKSSIGLSGGVQIPGKYEYIENESVYELIQLAGGFTDNSDSSKVSISRFIDDVTKKIISINSVASSKNVVTQPEDHIIVSMKKDYKRQDLVTIEGEVKSPGEYSIDSGVTTIIELMEMCGGYSNQADKNKILVNNVEISRVSDPEYNRITLIPPADRSDAEKAYLKARSGITKGLISSSNFEHTQSVLNFEVNAGDVIQIPRIVEYVEVLGAVLHPGRYPFYPKYNIENYIELSGGLTKNSTRDRYIIKASSGQRKPISKEVKIENGDIIFIAEKLEYNKLTRFKEITSVIGQIATIYLVIQSALGN